MHVKGSRKDLAELADMPESDRRAERPQRRRRRHPVPQHRRGLTERSMSQSSMQSAPSAIADTNIMTFRSGFATPARSPRSTTRSTNA